MKGQGTKFGFQFRLYHFAMRIWASYLTLSGSSFSSLQKNNAALAGLLRGNGHKIPGRHWA